MHEEITATIDAIHDAIDQLDRKEVSRLSDLLLRQLYASDDGIDVPASRKLLAHLRNKRFFAPMERISDVLIQTGHQDLRLRRQFAQALIDQSELSASIAVLQALESETRADPGENAEARGLLGRAHKQVYVNAARGIDRSGAVAAWRSKVMSRAIAFYRDAYVENPEGNYWHGINAVACAMRAARDGMTNIDLNDSTRIARDILKRIEDVKAPSIWELATAMEACVALGNGRAALGWAVEYTSETQSPRADAFEIGSTLRQLTEVWELSTDDGIGRLLLPVLSGTLLRCEGGGFQVPAAEVRSAPECVAEVKDRLQRLPKDARERVHGNDAFTSLDTYLMGVQRARCVARVGREVGGRGDGTGSLVWGRDIADRFGDQWLLMTNAHVISTKAENEAAVAPDEAVVTFEAHPMDGENKRVGYRVKEVVWESDVDKLDCALVTLNAPVGDIGEKDRCDIAPRLPVNNGQGRVYIIGHPSGGSLSYSLQDNLLLDYDDSLMHYRTPTEGGSSGSPVYNASWRLVGLHHAGAKEMPRLHNLEGTYEANEGIWIQAIRQAAAQ